METLIPYYPKLDENNSQIILHLMAEFNKLKATREIEKRATLGESYKHQITVARLIFLLDRLFLIHEPGTGKTHSLTAATELIKDSTNIIRKFYVIVLSRLIESTKYQMICKCTNNKYINDTKKSNRNNSSGSATESFSSNYELISYDIFEKKIKGKTVKELKEEFSYCMFSLDEVNHLINVKFSLSVNENRDGESLKSTEKLTVELRNLKYIKDLDDPSIINSDIGYIQYWRLFHCIDNSKVIFATGTPMMNRPSEFFLLCNLLLPLDKQMDVELFSSNVFHYNLVKYSPYLNGLISYIASSDVVARPNYIGKKIIKKYLVDFPADDTSENSQIIQKSFDSQLCLYKVELFGYQANKIFENKEDIYTNVISSDTSQYICYVDYKGKSGTEANKDMDTLKYLTYPNLNGSITKMKSCAIFSEIVRIEKKAYRDSQKQGKNGPGLCFSYLPLTKTAVGSFKTVFKAAGFEIFENFSSLKNIPGNYCEMSSYNIKGLEKKPRVVFLDGDADTDSKIREIILQIANSPDNVNGEYIQFINASEILGIGSNVKNAKRFIRPLPEWNEAKDKQTRDRVFREDSHDEIRKQMADNIEPESGHRPNPYDLDLYVDVYNMCAFCRYYYVDTQYLNKFTTNPFSVIKNTDNMQIHIEDNKMLIDSSNYFHIVGFVKNNTCNFLDEMEILEYTMFGENPHVSINTKFNVNITSDLNSLTSDMDIILCSNGLLIVRPLNMDMKMFLKTQALLYHQNCDFMQNYGAGFHENVCTCVIFTDTTYELIPVHMLYISPSEKQYIHMEEKSFATSRVLRYGKRFASDCINNHERTYSLKATDGSLECNYEGCNYTCSSSVLSTNYKDPFIDQSQGIFWSNYETLYGGAIIEQCKNHILGIFKKHNKIPLIDIFNELSVEGHREYFIKTAICDLITHKHKILDSFGITCYIAASHDELFLKRDFPKTLITSLDNTGDYINKLIAIDNEPDYRFFYDIDSSIIEEIENLTGTDKDLLIANILDKIARFKNFYSNRKLIERCFGRIIYNIYVEDNSALYNPEYRKKDVDSIIINHIFSIKCFRYTDPETNVSIYAHNQSDENKLGEQGKIAQITKGPFYVFSIKNGHPFWIPATENENKNLENEAEMDINNRIENLITKTITYKDPYNNESSIIVKSDYYVSYYNGVFRIVSGKGTGRNISDIDSKYLNTFISWFEKSQFIVKSENQLFLHSLKDSGSKKDKTEKLIDLFKMNDLIFYYSIKK